jgi:membrane-associated phospholipid phosphatase
MEHILDQGICIIMWLQQASPALDIPFKALTFLGEEAFFLLVLPFLYWCIDRSLGARITLLFLFSAWLNASAKIVAAQPRPFEYDPRIQKLAEAGGGGLPSGHTQGAVVFWGYLAAAYSRRWLWIVAAFFIILIPLSRLYLGMHFPTDLIGGYVIGAGLLIPFLYLQDSITRWVQKMPLVRQLGLAISLPALMTVLSPGLDKNCIIAAATLMGIAVGFVLEQRFICFETKGTCWRRILRFIVGISVIMALWLGLKAAFTGLEPTVFFRFTRYTLMGLWGALGAPWLFVRLGLADSKSSMVHPSATS